MEANDAGFTAGNAQESDSPARATTTPTAAAGASRQEGPWTVRALLAWMTPFLRTREVDSPRAVAEILLAEVLHVERLRLYMEPDRAVAPIELARLRDLVARAGRHEPVQFLVGRWPFLGRDFEVAPCTLIPRPCTELLVERAVDWYRARREEQGHSGVRVLDLCTGSGCIAVSVALGIRAIARPEGAGCTPLRAVAALAEPIARDIAEQVVTEIDRQPLTAETISVVATDIVPEAVELAQRNARRLGASIDFRVGDLFAAIKPGERFDLIMSNPPYVSDAEYGELDANVKEYEPASALRGGPDGLDIIRRVVRDAADRLNPGGLLLVEIGWKHGEEAQALCMGRSSDGRTSRGESPWSAVEIHRDGDGQPRILSARRA